jgi:hypothetical protein
MTTNMPVVFVIRAVAVMFALLSRPGNAGIARPLISQVRHAVRHACRLAADQVRASAKTILSVAMFLAG